MMIPVLLVGYAKQLMETATRLLLAVQLGTGRMNE
jgi:hypothetical protein